MQNLSCFIKRVSLVGLLGVALLACAGGDDDETSDPQAQGVESVETASALDVPYIGWKKPRCLGRGGVVISAYDSVTRKACKKLGGTGEICALCDLPGCSPTTVCILP